MSFILLLRNESFIPYPTSFAPPKICFADPKIRNRKTMQAKKKKKQLSFKYIAKRKKKIIPIQLNYK